MVTVQAKGLPQRNALIEVYDLNNRLVATTTVKNNGARRIDLCGQAAGMYVVVLRMEDKVLTRKLMVQ